MKDLYNNNDKTLLKEIEEGTNEWKDKWKNWYCENVCTTQSHLWMYPNPTKIPGVFLTKIEEKKSWNLDGTTKNLK